MTNQTDLQGVGWLDNLPNPQGGSLDTAQAEGGITPAAPAPTQTTTQTTDVVVSG